VVSGSGRTARRLAGAALTAAAVAAPVPSLGAQAGAVKLHLRPRSGDTLHLRFEQAVYGGAEAAADAARAGKVSRLLSSMTVLSRSVVEQSDASGSVVVAHTDSVVLRMLGAPPEALERSRRGMQGKTTRMRVAPDGAMRWSPDASRRGDTASGAALGLPGALPAMPVAVGSSWTRTMPLPWADGGVVRGDVPPRLEVTFHLDSIARGGAMAFVSMRGRLLAVDGAVARVGGASVTAGTADGALKLDLARGWIVDSRADFVLDILPPATGSAPGQHPAAPMRLRISQRLTAR
jgi:hypothetical protein